MTPEQREEKNGRLREWRRKKRQDDPAWREKQAAYSKAYSRSRRNDGTDFDSRRKRAGREYYHRLTETEEGRKKVREASLRGYRRRVKNEESKAKLRERQRDWARSRRRTDPEFAIKCHLRARLSDLVRTGRCKRDKSALALTGATLAELRLHLEGQFAPGMSWANYGEWHIDHVIPCAQFDLTDTRQQAICFNYLNLRPRWAVDNIRKGGRIEQPSQLPLGI